MGNVSVRACLCSRMYIYKVGVLSAIGRLILKSIFIGSVFN